MVMTCHTKDYYYMKYVDEKHNLGMREEEKEKRGKRNAIL